MWIILQTAGGSRPKFSGISAVFMQGVLPLSECSNILGSLNLCADEKKTRDIDVVVDKIVIIVYVDSSNF